MQKYEFISHKTMKPTTLFLIVIFHLCPLCVAQENDIVINEIMADPSPAIALPEWEYIELYNTSDAPINIRDWILIIGKKEYIFENDIEIQADEYLVLCHDNAVTDLEKFGDCYGFSSFQITNSGTSISLVDDDDNLISSVEFDVNWHSTSYKEEGGWSLEQIDPFNPCVGKNNWESCISKNGGTPSMPNSILNDNPIPPKLDHINLDSTNCIEVFFNQNMNLSTTQNIDNYRITELDLKPQKIESIKHQNNYVKLHFDFIFEENKLYTLNINNVINCKDIPPEDEIFVQFGIPSSANRNDIIINEILFNPINPGVDYLELYNRSDKVIDLKELTFGTIKQSFPNPPDTSLKEIISESRYLLPHSYILLSTDSEIVKYQYNINYNTYNDYDNCFLEVKSFPSLPNTEGRVVICDKASKIIDEMYYSEEMHYELLTITQGVSLERISFEKASLDENNWHSASFNFNYGTPGYKNSMAVDSKSEVSENEIDIIPEIFSPNGDAYDDICGIYYNLDKNEYSINIKVFNSNGLLIRNLLNNNLTNNQDVIYWDGCDDNNRIVEAGIYIIMTEIFDLEGNVKRFKNVVTVAI